MNQKDTYTLNFSNEINLGELQEHYQEIELAVTPEVSTSTITGKVEDQDGVDVENATVKLFDTEFNPIKHTMTNADGNYTFQNVPKGDYIVYSVKDGYSMSTKRPLTYNGTDVRLNDFVITEDTNYIKGNIYGYVYDDHGNVFGSAVVKLINETNVTVAETVSAIDGEFIFNKIDAGTYTLTASADDYTVYTPYVVEVVDGTNTEENIHMKKVAEAKEGTINGIIYNSSRIPIIGAVVGLYQSMGEGEEKTLKLRKTCRTNSEGRYFFGVVPEGKWVVKAKATENR